MTKTMRWTLEPATPVPGERARRAAAWALRRTGYILASWARSLRQPVAPPAAEVGEPVFEFYAEAGAPEGALYVDGQRIGVLEGVTRL